MIETGTRSKAQPAIFLTMALGSCEVFVVGSHEVGLLRDIVTIRAVVVNRALPSRDDYGRELIIWFSIRCLRIARLIRWHSLLLLWLRCCPCRLRRRTS